MNRDAQGTGMTTHAAWGAGRPRLLVGSQESRFVFDIPDEGATIGAARGCDLRLPGADPLHAIIRHDSRDEYTLALEGGGETSANTEKAQLEEQRSVEVLRTGAQFTIGGWRLVFVRDEFADHGRPYGGREGGELSDQPVQAPRPDYRQQSAAAQAAEGPAADEHADPDADLQEGLEPEDEFVDARHRDDLPDQDANEVPPLGELPGPQPPEKR